MKSKRVTIGSGIVISFMVLFGIMTPAFAHVVVKPSEVGVAAFETFTIGVPNEKDTPTIGVRLTLPEGLKEVSPNVKPGWTVVVKKNGTGDGAMVTEIDWTGGNIPVGQRDDFLFSAQVPSDPTTLKWKAYQTYQDGSVVAWDADPSTIKNGEEGTPYSQTKVINDLTATTTEQASAISNEKQNNIAYLLSIIAVVLSATALGMQLRKK